MANKRPRRYIFVFILILLLGSTGIFLTKTDAGFTFVYKIVQTQLDRQYGLDLSIKSISTPMRTQFEADQLKFANADSSLVLTIDTLNINYSGIFELFGRRQLDILTLIEPDISIYIRDNGQSPNEIKEIEFPQFLIHTINVERATVHIYTPDTLIHQRIDDLSCHYSGKKDGARIEIFHLDLKNEDLGISIKDLSSEISFKRDIAKLRNLKFSINESKISSQGKIRYVNPMRFQLKFDVNNFRIEEFVDLPLVHMNDKIDLSVDMQGNFKEFTALMDVEGNLNEMPIKKTHLNLEYKDEYIHLLEGVFTNDQNNLSFYGSYGLKDQYFSGSLISHELTLADWITNVPEFNLQGYLRANGYLNSQIKLNYDLDCFDLYDLDKANFAGNILFDQLDKIVIDSTNRLLLAEGAVRYQGSIFDLNELDIHIKGDVDKISALEIPGIEQFNADTLLMTLNVKGEIRDPDIEMTFNLDTLKYNNINVENLNVSLFSKNTITQPGGALLVSMDNFGVDSITLGEIQTYVHMQEDFIELDYLDIAHENYNLSLSGTVDNYSKFVINRMQGVYQGEEVYLLEPVSFSIEDDKYSLSRFDILYRDALLYGVFDVIGDSLKGSVNIAGAELNSLPLLPSFVDSINGVLDMSIDVNGSMSDPSIEMGIQLKRAHALGLEAKKIRSEMSYKDSLVHIQQLNMEIDDERVIALNGIMPLGINFNSKEIITLIDDDSLFVELQLDKVRLEKLLPFVLPFLHIVGEADGRGIISGTINDPIMDADLAIYDPEIELITADSIHANYHYSDERIYFNDVDLYANNGFYQGNANFYMDLRLQTDQERYQPDSSIYAYVKGHDDEMIYLTPFIDPIESLSGDFYTEMEMRGNFNETYKDAKLTIENGALVIDILGNEIRNISGYGIMKDNIAQVHLRGLLPSKTYSLANILGFEESDSNFTVDGTLDMRYLISPRFDLNFSGEQLSIVTLDENVNLTTENVDLDITGRDTLTVTGDVTLSEGSIEYGFNRSAPTASAPPSEYEGIKTAYSINAMVDKIYFRNQLLDVTLNGEMLLQKYPNEVRTRMGGELEVTEGFFNYWASVFTLEQGSSLILDQFENNHQLNFIANKEITVEGERNTIIASITGELNNPEINFTDDNGELSQAQIVQALTVGEIQNVLGDFTPGGGPDEDFTLGVANALLTLSEVPIEQQARQIGSAGGLDRIDIKSGTGGTYIKNGTNGTYIDKTAALVIGGRIGRNFYLTYEASQANLMNMEFEYRLNNKVAIVGAADMKKVEGAVRLRLQY